MPRDNPPEPFGFVQENPGKGKLSPRLLANLAAQSQTSIAEQPQILATATFAWRRYSPETTLTPPDPSDFIKQADTAMLEAQKAGRNRVGIAI